MRPALTRGMVSKNLSVTGAAPYPERGDSPLPPHKFRKRPLPDYTRTSILVSYGGPEPDRLSRPVDRMRAPSGEGGVPAVLRSVFEGLATDLVRAGDLLPAGNSRQSGGGGTGRPGSTVLPSMTYRRGRILRMQMAVPDTERRRGGAPPVGKERTGVPLAATRPDGRVHADRKKGRRKEIFER